MDRRMVQQQLLPTAKDAVSAPGGTSAVGGDGGRREPPPVAPDRNGNGIEHEIEAEFREAFDLLDELHLRPSTDLTLRQCLDSIIGLPRNYWPRALDLLDEYEATHDALDGLAKPCSGEPTRVVVDRDACLRDKLAVFLHRRVMR